MSDLLKVVLGVWAAGVACALLVMVLVAEAPAVVFLRALPPLLCFGAVALLLQLGLAENRINAWLFGVGIGAVYAIVISLITAILTIATPTMGDVVAAVVAILPATVLGGALAAVTKPERATLVWGYAAFSLLLVMAVIGFSTPPILLLTPVIVAYLVARMARRNGQSRRMAIAQGSVAAGISGVVFAAATTYLAYLAFCADVTTRTACIVFSVRDDSLLSYGFIFGNLLLPLVVGCVGALMAALATEPKSD